MKRSLKIIKLLDVNMCTDCRFNEGILSSSDTSVRAIRCTRLDCDNWDYSTVEDPPQLIKEDGTPLD